MNVSRVLMVFLMLALAACGNKGKPLSRIEKTGDGPDEFTIIPSKPLQAPESYAALPTPTPGGSNLTDQYPLADGAVALGGNPAALATAGIPATDAGLVRHASRYGVNPGIRQTLRAEDDDVRRRHGRVNILNIGPVDDYTNAYRRQWLNSDAEFRRLRRAGITVPSAPPKK
ncbi:DUF3035 domain-containing protein [Roseovarius aestuarii]|uniref:Beta-barrel assembly machine subunit BamF n=1 Tax=Roseovarius aestuarii TaxID=475083 RepID=A0A1X7BYI1_9RHOB|nr:DUF3035 domain-containing protein [Roseovarius aestuarii]SMC14643.1 hypothetical protein ROA7745_04512 [Roseovarius aestuarii]